jgi:hypothetical protein
MNFWESYLSNLFSCMGFGDFNIQVQAGSDHAVGTIFFYDSFFQPNDSRLPEFISNLNHIVQLVAKKEGIPPVFFDVNNYRHHREELIRELARTAARKVSTIGAEVTLPSMNSYERRIVHTELVSHPHVRTESAGVGRDRHVVIRPVS